MTKTITFMDRLDNFRSVGSEMAKSSDHFTKTDIFNILSSYDIKTSTGQEFFHQFCHFFDGMTGNNNSQNRTASAGAQVAKMELDNLSTPSLAKHIRNADNNISFRNAFFLSAFTEGYHRTLKQSL